MKLATLKDGSRDGQLAVVSRDLSTAHYAQGICHTLQQALDSWAFYAPQLEDLSTTLNHGKARHAFPFDSKQCMSPLPRAFQWADGSAYVNHVDLVRRSRNADMPESFWTEPLMYQGGSDDFIGPCDDALFASEDWGIDFEGEVAVITDDVPFGCKPATAGEHIRLLMLVNDWSLRGLIPAEITKGFGFFQGKPATAFSPVAVTPDELGEAWQDGMVHLPLRVTYNGKRFGNAHAGTDMVFNFPKLVSHIAKTRRARAGSIVGSGTVSNKAANEDAKIGYSCLAEIRAIQTIASAKDGKPGTPSTEFMKFGDSIKIEMFNKEGQSIFGAIDQKVVKW
jgi:fumarylacetoacetate (FAA) hydrolase